MKTNTILNSVIVFSLFVLTVEPVVAQRGHARRGSGHQTSRTYRAPQPGKATQSRTKTVTGPNGSELTFGSARGMAHRNDGPVAGRARGVKIETPNGRTITKGSGIAVGQNTEGRFISGGTGRSIHGDRGAITRGSHGVRIQPTDSKAFRRYTQGAVVRGPAGQVIAAGHRTHAIGPNRHLHASQVRRNVVGIYPMPRWFDDGWYHRYPAAWRVARWNRAMYWAHATTPDLYVWMDLGTPVESAIPAYDTINGDVCFDYGTNITYEGDNVLYGNELVATAGEYYESAQAIATESPDNTEQQPDPTKHAERSTAQDGATQWKPLGIFAMVQGNQTQASQLLQLAVSNHGELAGTYYDSLTQSTLPVTGSMDKDSKRVAWTVGDNQETVYETGLKNLTQDESPMLIHFGKETTQQWLLVRLESPN